MNSDLHLFNQLFEEGEDPSFHLAPSLPSLQELFADRLDLFLRAWELPTHTAARWEELRGLYSLTERISLQYCRSDQLERELRQLGVFDEREVKQLTDGLQVFLKIVRSSELQSIRLCTLEMLELWWQALPEAFAWDQLKLMRSWGLDVAWRKEAWRVWGGFSKANSPYQNTQGSGFHFVSRWPRSVIARSPKWKSRSHDGREYIYVRKALAKQVPTAQRVEFKCTGDGLRRKPLQVMQN